MNRHSRTITAALAAALFSMALSTGRADEPATVGPAPFVGYQFEGFSYDGHYCWVLDDTPYAESEAMAVLQGDTETPTYTFEMHSEDRWDICLWDANDSANDPDYDTWNYRNCSFNADYMDSSWNTLIAGNNEGSYTRHPDPKTIVYEGAVADLMICADVRSYSFGEVDGELLLFEGDTGEPDAAE